MKLGLFIGRMNPPHIGHTKVIKKALLENDIVLVLLGSVSRDVSLKRLNDRSNLHNKLSYDNKNPLTYLQRKMLLQKLFWKSLIIWEILDTLSDQQWVSDIAEQVHIHNPETLSIYWGDFTSDSAILALKEYEDKLLVADVEYKQIDRFLKPINLDGQEYDISGTTFRKALEENNIALSQELGEAAILEDIKTILTK